MADNIDYGKYVADLVAASRKAQAVLEGYTQEQVDELCTAIAYYGTRPDFMRAVAEQTVEETGFGNVEDKIAKIWNKVMGHYRDMKDERSVGLIDYDEVKQIAKYAKPVGVIGALAPVTNAENTPICKAMSAIKGRNAIIIAPHPKSSKVNLYIMDYLRKVLKKFGAPEDLISTMEPEYVSIDCSSELMKQVDFIWATGGSGMVKAAYSSGTPAIGVGTGNDPVYVDGTTDLDEVADKIRRSKIFDNSASCSSENAVIIQKEFYDDFVDALKRNHGYHVTEGSAEKEQLKKTMWPNWPEDHNLNRHFICQGIEKIAEMAGLNTGPEDQFVFVDENDGIGHEYPFTGEKLSRVTTLIKADSFEDALQKMEKILSYMGEGHGCGIHTSDDEKIAVMAQRMKVSRIMVNQPQSVGNSGSWENGMPMTMTLGCGSWGNNSVSHNVNFRDFLNITHVSKPLPARVPAEEELFPEEFVAANQDSLM